ncbi:MAG: hypothetical protein ACU84J_15105, partial [Gammaproteobacteria bacterium]
IYFIAVQFYSHKDALLAWRPDHRQLRFIGLAIVIYAAANYLLAFAWLYLLKYDGRCRPNPHVVLDIYGKSQIAKYVPGNVLHIGSRHLLGRANGIAHHVLAFAALYEIAGLMTAAALITLCSLQALNRELPLLQWLAFGSPLILIGYLFFPVLLGRLRIKTFTDVPQHKRKLLVPLLCYGLFFLLAGCALLLLLSAHDADITPKLLSVSLPAFAIAWSIGFITPGAPSGIGIREGTLILLLGTLMAHDSVILAVILFRLVTVLGDCLFLALTRINNNYNK